MKEVSDREKDMPKGVIGKLLRIASEEPKVISLGPGEPDFITPKPILSRIPKIISNRKNNRVTHYSSPQGVLELREAIAKKLRKDNKIKANPDEIFVTGGSEAALFSGFLCALDPKDRVAVQSPGYLGYIPGIELVSAIPDDVPLREDDNFEIDPDEIRKRIKKKTKVIMLNTPSNPTGTVISKKVLEEVADIAVDNDCYVFCDEAYEKLVYDKKHVSMGSFNGMKDYVVTFQSFSKSYAMCGFRLGYAHGPKELIKAMAHSMHYINICAPHLSQQLGIEALKLKKKYIDNMLKEYRRRRDFIVKRLNEVGLRTRVPDATFYSFSSIDNFSKDSFKFSNMLLKKAKVAVVPGREFGKYGEGYIRCSYATDYKLIGKALDRIEKVLK